MKALKLLGIILLIPFALAFFPSIIGLGLAWIVWKTKRIKSRNLRIALIACFLLFALIFGSAEIVGIATNKPTPSPTPTVSQVKAPTPTIENDDPDNEDTVLPPKFKAYSTETVQTLQQQTNSIAPNTNTYCSSNPLEHVYHPQRLQVINNCIQVSGTVDTVTAEPDGDYHINVKLDQQYKDLINDKNTADERDDLVVETVCEHNVTQADAESTCASYHSNVSVPTTGTHVFIVGAYVLDRDHGWMEIHPATYIGNVTVNVSVSTSAPVVLPVVPNTNTPTNNTTLNTSSTVQPGQATGMCNDGTETYAVDHRGACSHHGGVANWY